ncbi:MAG: helix-turn-helix transcriptional regulator [Dehalococcoidia bacterium]|nr:helix-turn-helix transcriptional regulator [Dehalococcoidia bacterium]
MSFGALLRQYRERRGVSCSELGRRTGLHYSYISRLERDARHPSLAAVERIERALALSAEERNALRAAAGYPPVPVAPALADLFLLLAHDGLDVALRRALYADLRALVERYRTLAEGENAHGRSGRPAAR